MLTRSGQAAARRKKPKATIPRTKEPARQNRPGDVGTLPEWDLSDLYPGLESPEITGDLARSDALCLSFEEQYKGKLAGLSSGPARRSRKIS